MNNEKFPSLFSEGELSNIKLENRVGLAPMTRTSATESGLATEDMAQYYANFARGGFGLILTEGTYTDELYSQGYWNQPGIATKEQAEAWKPVVEAVHQEGAKIISQLMHAGALSQGNRFNEQTAGPSAVKPKGEQLGFYGGQGEFQTPQEMTQADIDDVIAGFVTAAKNAKEVGFDGVEIHGANGYVLDQFLTDYTNQRDDEYGGSVENRLRLALQVTEAVRHAVGSDFPVGIRISQAKVNDADHKWANGEAEAEAIFSRLQETGVDYIHIAEPDAASPAFGNEGPTLVELAKRHGKTFVIANGSIGTGEAAEAVLGDEKADLVTIGKAALANQDWAKRVAEGQKLEAFDFQKMLLPKATLKPFEYQPLTKKS
ncbi:oxidoreductase [Planococcus lenghuensis]|uniref:NADH:flavin oxidoreductase n=1 Tax=Planococcus lenghuensis TaxID=2213202 RepID=A0A1Q2L3R5_9BACL|nr:NADH:flavin oxidoreductase [Planococcus lenghuensis]AQQ55066.1 NADH:flavin oxidoreductase [Planococcus lenghuensis]